MTAAQIDARHDELEKARSEIFAALDRCPCCGAERKHYTADNGDAAQGANYHCGSVLYRLCGSEPSVASVCPAPSFVALKGLEIEAAKAVAS